MRKLNKVFFAVVAVLLAAMPVLAQAPAVVPEADNSAGLKAIAAGIGFAIAVFGGAVGSVSDWSCCMRRRGAQSGSVGEDSDDDDFGSGSNRIAGTLCAGDRVCEDLVVKTTIGQNASVATGCARICALSVNTFGSHEVV